MKRAAIHLAYLDLPEVWKSRFSCSGCGSRLSWQPITLGSPAPVDPRVAQTGRMERENPSTALDGFIRHLQPSYAGNRLHTSSFIYSNLSQGPTSLARSSQAEHVPHAQRPELRNLPRDKKTSMSKSFLNRNVMFK